MKKYAAFAASVAISAATLVGCGGDDDFCSVASDTDIEASDAGDVEDALNDMADAAPDDIKSDVEALRDAAADPEAAAKSGDDLQASFQRVDEYVNSEC